MIVDDSEADQFIIENLIGKLDEQIHLYKAGDGQEALEFIQDYNKNNQKYKNTLPLSLIFLDINMPRMNGFEFLEEYKNFVSEKKTDPIPVIISSSSDEQSDRDKAKQYYFVEDYVVKPVELEDLNSILKLVISQA